MIFLFIVIGILLLVLLFIFIKLRFINTKKIKRMFNTLSITVTGKRGSGKDVLFSYVSYGTEHNSNVVLQENTNLITLQELLIPGVSREKLMFRKKLDLDFSNYAKFNNNTFISDSGVYFPNFEDATLKKQFPNLAITIAIWRHLFDGGLHWNVQEGGRLWIIIREQIEDIIRANYCVWLPFYVFENVTYFEKMKDYEDGREDLNPGFLHRKNGSISVERAYRGEVKSFSVLLPRRKINHDSRYFKKLVFKEVEENEKK